MKEIISKTIITKSKLPNVEWVLNPYVGCTTGCSYCYARFMGRFTGHGQDKWGTYVDWKSNAVELLKKEAPKIKKKGGIVLLGSVTDSYQPLEKKLKLTREILKVLLENQIPISILTKSDLILRDIDLLEKFDYCEVGISLGTYSNEYKIFESRASSHIERINVLKMMYKKGNIKTYAFVGPIHPFISKMEDIFHEFYNYVDFAMGEIINLKCGNTEDVVASLQKNSSISVSEYFQIAKSDDFFNQNLNLFDSLCLKYNIPNKGFFKH